MQKSAGGIKIRKSNERGFADHGWLKSYHTFSFADYYDPQFMGFRTLRVINDDRIAAGKGFGMHPHRDMEIISYVVEGELAHKDSMGNGSVIKAGQVQKMTAGTGVTHSEFNPSAATETRLLQIWIVPQKKGLRPSYQELKMQDIKKDSGLALIVSPDEKDGVVTIYQDVRIYLGRVSKASTVDYPIGKGRGIWVQMIEGKMKLNGNALEKGDGVSVDNESRINIDSGEKAEFLLFDLM